MSIVAELTKLQERKEALLREVAQIDKELESVAMALGVRPTGKREWTTSSHAPVLRNPRHTVWPSIESWLKMQPRAQKVNAIADATQLNINSVYHSLKINRALVIKRGTRYGLSETQFSEIDLEGSPASSTETESPFTSPTALSMNGATATSSALMTTANIAPVATEIASMSEPSTIDAGFKGIA